MIPVEFLEKNELPRILFFFFFLHCASAAILRASQRMELLMVEEMLAALFKSWLKCCD